MLKMSSLSLIIQREYLTRVRKKSFIILTLLMPFLMVALSLVPFWLSTLNDGSVNNVAVIDKSGFYATLLESTDQFDFQIIGEADQQESETRLGKDLFAILQITNDLNKDPRAVSLTSEKQAPMELQSVIERTLNEKVTEQRLDELTQSSNVDSEAIGQVRSIIEDKSGITLRTLRMGDDGSVKESSTEIASIIGMVFTILIYMFILLYGNMVMQAVLEEKKSRVVEVMVSSVKPVNLLMRRGRGPHVRPGDDRRHQGGRDHSGHGQGPDRPFRRGPGARGARRRLRRRVRGAHPRGRGPPHRQVGVHRPVRVRGHQPRRGAAAHHRGRGDDPLQG